MGPATCAGNAEDQAVDEEGFPLHLAAAGQALIAWMQRLHLSPAFSRLVVKPAVGMAAAGVTPVRGVAPALVAAQRLCREVLPGLAWPTG